MCGTNRNRKGCCQYISLNGGHVGSLTIIQSEGIRSFVGLAVVTLVNLTISMYHNRPNPTSSSDVPSPISPCGMCRQVLREFFPLDGPVLLVPGDYPQSEPALKQDENKPGKITEGGVRETTLGALLPDSFGPEELELPRA